MARRRLQAEAQQQMISTSRLLQLLYAAGLAGRVQQHALACNCAGTLLQQRAYDTCSPPAPSPDTTESVLTPSHGPRPPPTPAAVRGWPLQEHKGLRRAARQLNVSHAVDGPLIRRLGARRTRARMRSQLPGDWLLKARASRARELPSGPPRDRTSEARSAARAGLGCRRGRRRHRVSGKRQRSGHERGC